MGFSFTPAMRQNVPLLISLAGGTGSGKTYSAMLLAEGLADGKRFAVIDTEAGRAKHYADRFQFDHGDLRAPFTPGAYLEAIKAADEAGYPVILVDSMSHEHAGEGGLLDMAEAELQRMAGDDWQKRQACAMSSWVKPKKEHKRLMNHLLQLRAHLIICFRAEEKIEMAKNDKGKMEVRAKHSRSGKDGWIPVCEKGVPFEMTCSFLLTDEHPGVPLPIKLQEQHRAFFPLDRPITAEAGRQLAAWAAGGTKAPAHPPASVGKDGGRVADELHADDGYLTADQQIELGDLLAEVNGGKARMFEWMNKHGAQVNSLAMIPADKYQNCKAWIEAATKIKE